jgi:uncharacterized protein
MAMKALALSRAWARWRHRGADDAGREASGATDVTAAQVVAPLASAIYSGTIRHRRHAPRPHHFRYRLFMLYLDLSELDRIFAGRWLWSVGRRNLAEFRRSDYLGDPAIALDEAVRQRVEQATGERPAGPIRLLTHLRYVGYCFNPVSLYYCFAADGVRLDHVVAEITNTPWGERHSYVLAAADAERRGSALGWRFDKQFHVSPFMAMERIYHWRLQPPDAALRIHMDVLTDHAIEFDATLQLVRRPLGAARLAFCLAAYPLMTARIWLAIHWQAFLIWCKHIPVHDHPRHRPQAQGPTR